jgi:large subunit ribosomal protein L13
MIVFDATGSVAGRLAALATKKALAGEDIVIVNAEKAIISGAPKMVVSKYYNRRLMTQKGNPDHAAKWPRRPDLLFKRIIRGMVPKKSSRGSVAYHKIKTFMGVPKEFEGTQKERFAVKNLSIASITLEQLGERLGWKAGDR